MQSPLAGNRLVVTSALVGGAQRTPARFTPGDVMFLVPQESVPFRWLSIHMEHGGVTILRAEWVVGSGWRYQVQCRCLAVRSVAARWLEPVRVRRQYRVAIQMPVMADGVVRQAGPHGCRRCGGYVAQEWGPDVGRYELHCVNCGAG